MKGKLWYRIAIQRLGVQQECLLVRAHSWKTWVLFSFFTFQYVYKAVITFWNNLCRTLPRIIEFMFGQKNKQLSTFFSMPLRVWASCPHPPPVGTGGAQQRAVTDICHSLLSEDRERSDQWLCVLRASKGLLLHRIFQSHIFQSQTSKRYQRLIFYNVMYSFKSY